MFKKIEKSDIKIQKAKFQKIQLCAIPRKYIPGKPGKSRKIATKYILLAKLTLKWGKNYVRVIPKLWVDFEVFLKNG